MRTLFTFYTQSRTAGIFHRADVYCVKRTWTCSIFDIHLFLWIESPFWILVFLDVILGESESIWCSPLGCLFTLNVPWESDASCGRANPNDLRNTLQVEHLWTHARISSSKQNRRWRQLITCWIAIKNESGQNYLLITLFIYYDYKRKSLIVIISLFSRNIAITILIIIFIRLVIFSWFKVLEHYWMLLVHVEIALW